MKISISILKHFHRLQWKLTISYLMTSFIVLLLLELLLVLISIAATADQDRGTLESRAQTLARIAVPALPSVEVARSHQQFQAMWELLRASNSAIRGSITAIDAQGKVIVSAGEQAPAPGTDMRRGLPASIQHAIETVLFSQPPLSSQQSFRTHTFFEQDHMYLVAPQSERETIRGALVITAYYQRFSWQRISETLLFFGVSAFVFFLGAGIVGLAFGVVTARSIVHRLQRITMAVDGWSQGNFSTFVRDPSGDELGQLARRLNQMAQQLQQLLTTRQDLATLEERNRLARELHDSVKQQVFAASLQISTTKALMGRDEETALLHAGEAETLIRQAQRELTLLIRELRPLALEGQNLDAAVHEYLSSWQKQTGINATLYSDVDTLPTMLEEALFRIIQEALTNVARHSYASTVDIQLSGSDGVTLTIADNGRGFDIEDVGRQGIGLSSMRERVQALHGQIRFQSTLGKGTTVIVQCVPRSAGRLDTDGVPTWAPSEILAKDSWGHMLGSRDTHIQHIDREEGQ